MSEAPGIDRLACISCHKVFVRVTSHERHGVSNHRQIDCFANSLFRPRTKKANAPYYWPLVREFHRSPMDSHHRNTVRNAHTWKRQSLYWNGARALIHGHSYWIYHLFPVYLRKWLVMLMDFGHRKMDYYTRSCISPLPEYCMLAISGDFSRTWTRLAVRQCTQDMVYYPLELVKRDRTNSIMCS